MRRQALAKLEGLVSEEVGLRLADLAASVPEESAIVEIGSYKGRSSCYLAEGARVGLGALIYCIEAWDSPGNVSGRFRYADRATRLAFEQQVESMGLTDRITAIQGFSHEVVRRWRRQIGLLFIDGSHRYEDVRADFEAWAPYIVPGGWLAFDDYAPKNRGVMRLVDKLKRNDPRWQDWDFDTPPLAIARRKA